MRNIIGISLLLLVSIISSCSSYKHVQYFQDLSQNSTNEAMTNYSPLIIKEADILAISVTSRNPESSVIFNYNLGNIKGTSQASPDNPVIGYLVDENGNIHLPYIGALKVAGLTTAQARQQLNDKLEAIYKDPVVNLRVINFKVAIYGDVLRPDIYSLQNEHTSITQALSLAGDLNITAKRKNVLLIRNEDGKRKFIRIDLTSKELFNSPYFYLKNNDEIYVQPDKTKYATVERGYRTTSLIISALSFLAVMVTALK